jgi:glycerophosphoryl diester phosphodiesterase
VPVQEWVEIHNPTSEVVDLSGHKIGDAVYVDDYEGTYGFPPGFAIQPGQVQVIAVTAAEFRRDFPSRKPDFEILDTDPQVPDMLDYPGRGEGDWGLKNQGDEVLLLDSRDRVIDVVVYGQGRYPGVLPHPGVAYGHSLERSPAWLDTDDCSADFRDWPYPNPGQLPSYGE